MYVLANFIAYLIAAAVFSLVGAGLGQLMPADRVSGWVAWPTGLVILAIMTLAYVAMR